MLVLTSEIVQGVWQTVVTMAATGGVWFAFGCSDPDVFFGAHYLDAPQDQVAAEAETEAPMDVDAQDRSDDTPDDTSDGGGSFAGLVMGLSMSEGSGESVRDSSPNGNIGTIVGAIWAEGRFGTALEFDGVEDRVIVDEAPSLQLTRHVTIEAWIYPMRAAPGGYQNILVKESNQSYALYMFVSEAAGRIQTLEVGPADLHSGPTFVPVGVWTHIASTYDGSELRVYVNGASAGVLAAAGTINARSGEVRIGHGRGNVPFNGRIDEVRLYNRALSAEEIGVDMMRSVE